MTAAPAQSRTVVAPAAAPAIRRHLSARIVFLALAALVAAAALSAATVDPDSGTDLLSLARSVGADLIRLRWQYLAIVAALAAVHYLAAALALRAAAGVPTPLDETTLVQLAAAAANRITPAGLGAAAVNVRYLGRRGLDAPTAIGAVAALSLLGAAADLLVIGALALGAGWLGVHGSARQLALLTAHIRSRPGPARSPWLWAAVGGLAAIALLGWLLRHRAERVRRWGAIVAPLRRLAHRPAALATLLAASAATTLVLAVAFAASAGMLPGPRPASGPLLLVLGYLLGAAAGNAVPAPAGLGSTDAALIAVLAGLHVPLAHAVEEVLVFRVLTFWAPAVVGVLAGRLLYRRGAL